MKALYLLPLILLAQTAHATSLPAPIKGIYCERNEFYRDGGKTVALVRELGDGRIRATMVKVGNMMGILLPHDLAIAEFKHCKKFDAEDIACLEDTRAENGRLEALDFEGDGLAYRYRNERAKGNEVKEYETRYEVTAKECREVMGVELGKLVQEIESKPVHSDGSAGEEPGDFSDLNQPAHSEPEFDPSQIQNPAAASFE